MRRTFLYIFIAINVFLLNPISSSSSEAVEKVDEKYIHAQDADLYCVVIGKGAPILVLHGGAGYLTHDHLRPHLDRLAQNNLVIYYDQRGLGRSTGDIDAGKINLDTYVEDIEAIRTSLGLQKISLLGHSFGSFLALHYALAHPESVDKLILMSSMPISSQDLGLFFMELMKRLAPFQVELAKIETSELYLSGDPQTVANQLKVTFQNYMFNPENINRVNLWKSQSNVLNGFKVWDIFKAQIFMKPYDLTAQLKTLRCPTLVVHGDTDPIPFVTAEHLHAAIPSSTLVKIDQSGHFIFVEQPEATFRAIKAFLE